MDQLREKTHTILFLQTSSSTSSRVWSDFDTPLETLEALIRTFETKLKEQNGTRDVAYTIAELHAFIDSIDDLGVLVFSPQLAAYRPFEREKTNTIICVDSRVKLFNKKDMLETQRSWLAESLVSNDRIMTLMEGLASNKCAFKPGNITVKVCKDNPNIAGGFHPEFGILLCSEYMYSKEALEDTLTHELVHAFDWCTMNWDLTNCFHQACSEVRAGLLSGDCRIMLELKRGKFPHKFGQERINDCVKRRAILSLLGNPHCNDLEKARKAIDQVFESCAKDTTPF